VGGALHLEGGDSINRAFAIVAGAVVGLLIAAAPALADRGTIHDPRGDVRFHPSHRADRDITRSSWRVASGGRLIHTVSVRGNIGDPRTGIGQLPQLQIDVTRRKSSSKSTFARNAKRGDGVSVRKVSRHTVKYAISEDALGDPKAYKWHFFFPARGCRRCNYDRIPDHGSVLHDLEPRPKATPIQHVVILYQENHSFDNVLGRLCAQTGRCDGTTEGTLPDGSSIPLRRSPDIVPKVAHQTASQNAAIAGGRMDGFGYLHGCHAEDDYGCFTQYSQDQIPNLWTLATSFAMSDRTFQLDSVPSFGAHLELVSATLDGFTGDPSGNTDDRQAPGWGCDSGLDAPWRPPGGRISQQPACVPDYHLNPDRYPFGGAYRRTRVDPTSTIMDRLDSAGLSWKLYAADPGEAGYLWAICPIYARCLYTDDRRNQVNVANVVDDARSGSLPNFSVVLPTVPVSQHNDDSMSAGDNWIGRVVSAIEDGPDWQSTAVFVTYDDCGCFYDHVPPPPGLGIRTPMVIVSPWVRPGFVDSNQASMASLLSFTEHTFNLNPLNQADASAYDYSSAFDFTQAPLPPVPMTHSKLSPRAKRVVRHPPEAEGS
jgi:phospholipase C